MGEFGNAECNILRPYDHIVHCMMEYFTAMERTIEHLCLKFIVFANLTSKLGLAPLFFLVKSIPEISK